MVQYNEALLVQFIKDNKQLILNHDFDKLYNLFNRDSQQLTQFLIDCGVNPLDFVTDIVEEMFGEVKLPEKFENLKIPDSVKSIGCCAFANCKGLKSIDLKNVESIGEGAFAYCTGLESIDFKNVKSIGEYAFYSCTWLKSIDLKNVESICNNAFRDCTDLKTVYAPKDLDLSEAGLLEDCKIIRR